MADRNEKVDRFRQSIKDNLSKIIIAIIMVSYVAQGLFQLATKTFLLTDFLGSLGTSMLCGLTIYQNMRISGINDGRRSQIFLASYNLYSVTKEKLNNIKRYMINAFVRYKNRQSYLDEKASILENVGLDLKLYDKGFYDKPEVKMELDKEQTNAIAKVKKNKIVYAKITANFLLTDSPQLAEKYKKKGKVALDEKDFAKQGLLKDAFSMIFSSAIASGFMLYPIINGESWASVLWNLWQVTIWFAFGIMKYFDARDFMENEYRQSHLVYKTETLEEFLNIMSTQPQLLEEFDYFGKELDKFQKEEIEENECIK